MTKSFIQISDSHIDNDKLVMGVDSQANLGNRKKKSERSKKERGKN